MLHFNQEKLKFVKNIHSKFYNLYTTLPFKNQVSLIVATKYVRSPSKGYFVNL